MANLLRNIPSVNELLERPALRSLVDNVSHHVVVHRVRDFLDNLRHEIQETTQDFQLPSTGELAERIANWIVQQEKSPLRPVINATGVLLHTGLGRAPLARSAVEAVAQMSAGYASLEVDLASGQRSQRIVAVERLLKQLTGAEAALVVNNNAGATMLALAALAGGKEVVVSRGHLVEIGGSYRLPEVMQCSQAVLREVGTTNKTRATDYAAAINDETAAILKVHPSNYVIRGFTEEASLKELVELTKRHQVYLIDDIGSGALLDLQPFGLQDEPIASHSIEAGADVVLFSGDKLLGGPQCGIIVGTSEAVRKISQHPMARALRVDKMTLAALQATLRLYQDPKTVTETVPLLSLLSTPLENLKHRADHLARQLSAQQHIAEAEPLESTTFLGGGSVPTQEIPTCCVAIRPANQASVDEFARRLRNGKPAVFARIQQDRVLLDLRSVLPDQDLDLLTAIEQLNHASGECQ